MNPTRVINVSNRLPVSLGEDGSLNRSSGGLVSALEGVGDAIELAWIGWPGGGIDDPAARADVTKRMASEFDYHPVFMSDDEVEGYYHGFSNSSLWPLLHYNAHYFRYQSAWYDAYEAINARFADAVVAAAQEGDRVWVHDYHLLLLPQMLRERRPDLRIGFFLHTPFPSYELFRRHPRRRELLDGVLGADLIGFHTFGYLRHFRSAVLRLTGRESDIYSIRHDDAVTSIGVFPIGINGPGFAAAVKSEATETCLERYRQDYAGCRLVLSVERLDYTKGIPQKLEAIEKFLETHPERRDDLVFIIIAVPSREDVGEYQQLKESIELAVSRINGKYATISNIPVHFINRGVKFEELCALYRLAEVCMVTPLIDGMNLVAKEYLACQPEDGTGVLMLSEFAGAAQELYGTLSVNPYDTDGMADALHTALTRPEAQRRADLAPIREQVLTNHSGPWAARFLEDLDATADIAVTDAARTLHDTDVQPFTAAAPGRKALFLDYDGTLRAFVDDPAQATPEPALRDVLEKLSHREDLEVFVVSGRKLAFLREHLGGYGFTLVGEHGYTFLEPGGEPQLLNPEADLTWMPAVKEVLQHYAQTTPGTHVEQKNSALVWHYRRADPEFGRWKALELIGHLDGTTASQPLSVSHGKMIVEVASQQINKGAAVDHFVHLNESIKRPFAATLCIGDDLTDETMFRGRTGDHVVTIRVGPGDTDAGFRVSGPKRVLGMLQYIAG